MEDWKTRYRATLIRYLIDHGYIMGVRPPGTLPSSWNAYMNGMAKDYQEVRAHLEACPALTEQCTFRETDWEEFAGTFVGSETKYGVLVTLVCACGEVTGRQARYEGSAADLMEGLLNDTEGD